MLVESWLARAAGSAPTAKAVETPTGALSYAQMHQRARAGAETLAERGARRGERVAIALPGGIDFVCALHSCLLTGAVAVPVDVRLGERERAAIVGGAAVVVDEPLPEAPRRGGLSAGGARRVPANIENGSATGATHDLDATAVIVHTSGTTAAPKPVELTYGNFLWSALGSGVALGVLEGGAGGRRPASRAPLQSVLRERWLCNLPVSHVGGLGILMRSVIHGTTAVVHERFDLELALRALGCGNGGESPAPVTAVSLVATTLSRLLDAGLRRPAALRFALVGGGPVGAALVERARDAGVPVSLTYGLTEACSQVTTLPLAAVSAPERPASHTAGPPLFCTRVRTAADGEIEVAGPTVARGAAGADGWLRTGDLGRLDAVGRLEVVGRKADTIVTGGENVAPGEVEAVLEEHPAVREAAVLGRADGQWGEAVTALVVARDPAPPAEEDLREHCARRLAPFKVPRRVEFISGPLPRTASGKLLRGELR
jgi:O-succinylbenzoic acid--CoA ligase